MTKNEEKAINEASAAEQARIEAMFEDAYAKIIEKAKAEAEKIIENAKTQTRKKVKPKNEQGEELVNYTFFKDSGEYSDDVYISVNGERIVCQRGVPVKIKRKFVWAYELAQKQQEEAANVVDSNERRYEQRIKEVGM